MTQEPELLELKPENAADRMMALLSDCVALAAAADREGRADGLGPEARRQQRMGELLRLISSMNRTIRLLKQDKAALLEELEKLADGGEPFAP